MVEVPRPGPEWVPLEVVVARPAIWLRAGPIHPDPDGVRRVDCSLSVVEFEAAALRVACVENGRTFVARPLHLISPSVRREGAFDDVVGNAKQEVNGEQRADFTDAVVVIEHQPTTLGKVRHHIMKDIVDLRMLYPFPLARELEFLLKLYFFIIQLIPFGNFSLDVHRGAFFRFPLHRRMKEDYQIFRSPIEAPVPRSRGRKSKAEECRIPPSLQLRVCDGSNLGCQGTNPKERFFRKKIGKWGAGRSSKNLKIELSLKKIGVRS